MEIIYHILTNDGCRTYVGNLSVFLLELHYLFLAKNIPPYPVVNDLCNSDPTEWGASNRVEWKKFKITEDEYEALCVVLSDKGYSFIDVPKEIDTVYKWSIWQYEFIYGVPYKKHKSMRDNEVIFDGLLKKAVVNGNENEVVIYHLKRAQITEEIDNFLAPYIVKKKS